MPSPPTGLRPSPECPVTSPGNVAVALGGQDGVSLALYRRAGRKLAPVPRPALQNEVIPWLRQHPESSLLTGKPYVKLR